MEHRKELRPDAGTAWIAPLDPKKRRLPVGKTTAAIVLVGGLTAGGLGLAAATDSSGPPPGYSGPDTSRYFPSRIPVAGPHGVAGYVPREDLVGPPQTAGPVPANRAPLERASWSGTCRIPRDLGRRKAGWLLGPACGIHQSRKLRPREQRLLMALVPFGRLKILIQDADGPRRIGGAFQVLRRSSICVPACPLSPGRSHPANPL